MIDYTSLETAKKILIEYRRPNSSVTIGNLYFCATEYKHAYEQLESTIELFKSRIKHLETELDCFELVAGNTYTYYREDKGSK